MHTKLFGRLILGITAPLFLFACGASAQEAQHILALETNSGSYYYSDKPEGKVILKAPTLRVRTDLIPIRTYAERWGEIRTSHQDKSNYTFDKTAIPENLRKDIPDEFISRKYSPVHYAVDGSDFCFPLNKGTPFKEFSTPVESVTPLPYQGKLCAISMILTGKESMLTGHRISILDAETAKEIDSFIVNDSPDNINMFWPAPQWVNDRYVLQVMTGRRYTITTLIDLKDRKILSYIGTIDPHNLDSAAVVNGKVMLFDENGATEYPLPR